MVAFATNNEKNQSTCRQDVYGALPEGPIAKTKQNMGDCLSSWLHGYTCLSRNLCEVAFFNSRFHILKESQYEISFFIEQSEQSIMIFFIPPFFDQLECVSCSMV